MNVLNLKLKIDFLNILMYLAPFFAISSFFFQFTQLFDQTTSLELSLFLVLIALTYYLIYRFSQTYLMAIVLSMVFFCLIIFSPYMVFLRITYGIISSILCIMTIHMYKKVTDNIPSCNGYMPMVIIIIFTIISISLDNMIMANLYFLCVILYIPIRKYNQYLINTYTFFQSAQDISNLSKRSSHLASIRWIRMALFLPVIPLCLTIFLPNWGLKSNLISRFIHYLISLINFHPSTQIETPPPRPTASIPFGNERGTIEKEINWDFKVNPYVIIGILGVMAIISIIFAIYSFKNQRRIIDRIFSEEIAELTITESLSKRNKKPVNYKNSAKIRRLFYKVILKNIDERLISNGNLTATQLCDRTFSYVNKDTLIQMKILYYKARYSNQSCTRNDVDQMKEYYKKISKDYTLYHESQNVMEKGVGGR